MKLPILIICCFALTCFAPCFAQSESATPDTTAVQDSVPPAAVKTRFLPNPKKSLTYSIIPGGGQFYNRRYWKVPIVYAAMGGMVYLISTNQTQYRDLKLALEQKLRGEEHKYSDTNIDNVNTLRVLRDQYDKYTQLSYIGTVLVYALQGVEAYTDAHLMNFDIDEDLSLQLKPHLELNPATQSLAPGMGLRLRFAK